MVSIEPVFQGGNKIRTGFSSGLLKGGLQGDPSCEVIPLCRAPKSEFNYFNYMGGLPALVDLLIGYDRL
jgi:hypothetical protein